MNFRKLFLALFVSFGVLSFVFGQNVNRLKIDPSTYKGKFYCPISFDVNTVNGGAGHTNAQFTLKFDSTNFDLTQTDAGSAWQTQDYGYYTGTNDSLYFVDIRNDEEITDSVNVATFEFENKNTNASSTDIKFVDKFGNLPTTSTFTAPVAQYKLTLSNINGNTLTGVDDATFDFEACPCSLDSDAPFVDVSTFSHAINQSTTKLVGKPNISVLFIDDGGSAWNYWYAGLSKTNANYTNAGVPSGMDNQEGVNANTLSVTIDYDDSYGVSDETLTGTSLSPVAYTGNMPSRPGLTWDNNNRGYYINFQNTHDYEVEKPVTITIEGYDNALAGNDPCVRSAQQGSYEYTFNVPVAPYMDIVSPVNHEEFVSPTVSPIRFITNDEWAGVDSGSIIIEIPTIMSGAEQILTGYVYSGSDLNIELIENGGAEGLGSGADYNITLNPKWEFPENTEIIISGYVADLAGNEYTNNWDFTTRPSCSFYGCSEILDVYIMGGSHSNMGSPLEFTGGLLIVTGTNANSPYPYLTGAENNILMCGFPWAGADLTGNIQIFEGNGSTPLTATYTGHELYVTGLNFTYSNGVFYIEN